MSTQETMKTDVDTLKNNIKECLAHKDLMQLEGNEDIITKQLVSLMTDKPEADIQDGISNDFTDENLIKLLFEEVLVCHEAATTMKITKNYKFDDENNSGVIDIVIETENPKQFIPIEIKTNAKCQKEQCARYLEKSKKEYKNCPSNKNVLYFLSLNYKYPSFNSVGNKAILVGPEGIPEETNYTKDKNIVKVISFEKEIYNWIKRYQKAKKDDPLCPVYSKLSDMKKALLANKCVKDIVENLLDDGFLKREAYTLSGLLQNNSENLKVYQDKNIPLSIGDINLLELEKLLYTDGKINYIGCALRRAISRLMNKQLLPFINKLADELYNIGSTKSKSSFLHDYSSKQIVLRKCPLEDIAKPESMGGEIKLILHYTKNVSLMVDGVNIDEDQYNKLIESIFRGLRHTKKDGKYYLLPNSETDLTKERSKDNIANALKAIIPKLEVVLNNWDDLQSK